MALDELKEGDTELKVGEFTFVIEESLTESFDDFVIDYNESGLQRGFSVTSGGDTGSSC